VEEARTAAAAATPPEPVAGALAALTPATSRHLLDLWTGLSRTEDGTAAITLAWSPRLERNANQEQPASVLAAVTSNGVVSQLEGTIVQRGPTFRVQPGEAKVVLTVRHTENRVLETETRSVTVPATSGPALAWSSPVLLRVRSPMEMRAISGDPNPPPFAGRDFSRTDRLLVRVALSVESTDATVTSRLVSRQGGRQLATLPIAPLSGQTGVYQVDLPLQSVAPGDYVIAVEASKGAEKVEALVAIRVGG
jgi:hypothetical protein